VGPRPVPIPDAGADVSDHWQDDFSRARNEILAKVETEWFLWLDADDILINGQLMQAVIDQNDDANCITFPYHYDQDEYGNLSVTLVRERLVRNPQEWKWVGTIHEVLTLPDKPWVPVYAPEIVVRHNPTRHKDKGTRNLDLLYKELEQTEPDPPQRLLFYLGRENASRGNMKEALLHFNRYIARSDRARRRYQVAVMSADALRASGRLNEAAMAAFKAISIMPTWPDAYHMLGRICYEERRFEEAIEWFRTGSEKEPPITGLITSPRTYDYWPAYYVGLSYVQLGDHQGALDNLKTAASLRPDAQLMALMAAEQAEVDAETMVEAFLAQHEQLARHDEWLKARQHFKTVPKLIERHPRILDALERRLWRRQRTSTTRGSWWSSTAEPALDTDARRRDLVRRLGAAPAHGVRASSRSPVTRRRLSSTSAARTASSACRSLRTATSSRAWICTPSASIWPTSEHRLWAFELGISSARSRTWRASTMWRWPWRSSSIFPIRVRFLTSSTSTLARSFSRLRSWPGRTAKPTGASWSPKSMSVSSPSTTSRSCSLVEDGFLTSTENLTELSSWIFASYRPRQTYAGSIAFLAPGTLEAWSPRKLREQGLGGSETALIRLAEELFLEAT
jgi:tetratricopeptide (TPR) repeat protein